MMDEGPTAVLLIRESPNAMPEPYRMDELKGLAETAGYSILAEITQRRERDYRFQLGRGKIDQALSFNPDKLIFYNSLSPGQVFNIRNEFSANVIDRFNLILEIFASRASTREAKLQVELAKLTYDAPHARQAASLRKFSEQPGFRGAGAYEQSVYRDIKSRIAKVKAALQEVEMIGQDRRQRRHELGFDLIALAGYTNAGKSTILNALTNAEVVTNNQLFTTLSPTTRAVDMKSRRVLLTDTVGFIDDLPHFLIKAFQSTLAEISQADLILLIADISDSPEILRRKLVASHKALWDCNALSPLVTILNKVDLLSDNEVQARVETIGDLAPDPVLISASTNRGLNDLRDRICQRLQPLKDFQIRLPYTPEALSQLSRLYRSAEHVNVKYEDEMVVSFRGREEMVSRTLVAGRKF
jgi:GTP-binding protein HflX